MVVYGWDASNHDWQRGPMDFAAARSAGVEFFTHKLTDGLRFYKDPYFARAITRARAAGIPLLGAYHVLWNGNVTAQMDWFLTELDAQCPWWRSGPFILQLDCEPFGYNGAAPTLATIRTAADYLVKATGGRYRPIVYAPQWVYRNTLTGLGYPLWASAYGTNPVGGFRDIYPGDGSSRWVAYSGQIPAVLQYGSQTRIGGQGTCDANVYRGSLAQLVALVSQSATVLAAVDPIQEALMAVEQDINYLAWRVEGLFFMRDKLAGGPDAGQAVPLVAALKDIQASLAKTAADLAAIKTQVSGLSKPVVNVDPATLAAELAKLLPAAPTAEQNAAELGRRLGNG